MSKRRLMIALGWLLAAAVSTVAKGQVDVSLIPITDGNPSTQGFAVNEINATFIRRNSLFTVEDQQFASYYYNNPFNASDPFNEKVLVAWRRLGSNDWNITKTQFTAANVNDGHDAISITVDGDGYLHMGWGVHVDDLRYTRSTTPVTGPSAPATISFQPQQNYLLPSQLPERRVTYPEFFNLPDGDLLLMFRHGNSGAGDTYLHRYDTTSQAWANEQLLLFSGERISGVNNGDNVNAYPNMLAFDSNGGLHVTWCWRTGSDSNTFVSNYSGQTNHHILYAYSPDEGVTWLRQDGTPYTTPITQVITGPSAGDIILPLPENSSLSNTSGMAVDKQGHPVLAAIYAPGFAEGNHTRQYMLVYSDGEDWHTSQISNRPTETFAANSRGFPVAPDSAVYDLSPPLVLVDEDDRVLVVMRYDERGHGVTVAYSVDRENWEFIDLTTENLGHWEPTYDPVRWQRDGVLSLLYQPVALGHIASTVSVLEWDARAYFAGVPEPNATFLGMIGMGILPLLRRRFFRPF